MSQKPDLKTRPRRPSAAPRNGDVTATHPKGGRGAETALEERQGIAILKARGVSNREIAKRTGRCPRTVARVLASPDVERLRAQAREALDLHLPKFAADLMKASTEGAKRGRHEPAIDSLMCLGVLQKPHTETAPRVVVNIGVLPGVPSVSVMDVHALPDPRRPDTDSGT